MSKVKQSSTKFFNKINRIEAKSGKQTSLDRNKKTKLCFQTNCLLNNCVQKSKSGWCWDVSLNSGIALNADFCINLNGRDNHKFYFALVLHYTDVNRQLTWTQSSMSTTGSVGCKWMWARDVTHNQAVIVYDNASQRGYRIQDSVVQEAITCGSCHSVTVNTDSNVQCSLYTWELHQASWSDVCFMSCTSVYMRAGPPQHHYFKRPCI